MPNKGTFISVIVPTYNRPKMLDEMINSFLRNTYQDFELVIVDDGSTEYYHPVKDPKVRYYKEEHGGISHALNIAKSRARGKYIMCFGDDDWSKPDHIETLATYLDTHPEIDAVYGDYETYNGHATQSHQCYTPIDVKTDYENCKVFQVYPHGGTMWRAKTMPDFDETLESAIDWELMFNCLENGVRFARVPKVLWTYRTGHAHEEGTQRQNDGCRTVLARRGVNYEKRING